MGGNLSYPCCGTASFRVPFYDRFQINKCVFNNVFLSFLHLRAWLLVKLNSLANFFGIPRFSRFSRCWQILEDLAKLLRI